MRPRLWLTMNKVGLASFAVAASVDKPVRWHLLFGSFLVEGAGLDKAMRRNALQEQMRVGLGIL